MRRSPAPSIGLSLLIAIVYFAAAELGLSLASVHENVTPVWPPTGIAIASLLIFGLRVWPGVFLGALAANFLTSIPVASTLGIAIGNTLVSATIGSLSVCFGDPKQWDRFWTLWLTWWMGDGFGALIVSPLLLSWSMSRKIDRQDIPEIVSLFILLLVVVLIVFAGWFPGPVKTYPLAYLCLPILLWAALRFDQRIVTVAIALMASVAVWG